MKRIVLASMVSLGMVGMYGVAFAATPPTRTGQAYTEALNIMSAHGYHGMNLISESGNIVHATALTRTDKTVSLSVNTATRTVQAG